MQSQKIQITEKVSQHQIVEYTDECLKHDMQLKIPEEVRVFIEKIQNWDLHCTDLQNWIHTTDLQKQSQFTEKVLGAEVFPLIKSAKIKTLFLFGHSYNAMLKEIVYPAYEKLRWLSLSDNKIDNIQAVAFLNVPVLERLCLNKNRILTTKALNKTDLKYLNRLNIQSNPNRELDIFRAKFAEIIENFALEGRKDYEVSDPSIFEYRGQLGSIFKLNSQKANYIVLKNSCRIRQVNFLPKISQRFNQKVEELMIFNY